MHVHVNAANVVNHVKFLCCFAFIHMFPHNFLPSFILLPFLIDDVLVEIFYSKLDNILVFNVKFINFLYYMTICNLQSNLLLVKLYLEK